MAGNDPGAEVAGSRDGEFLFVWIMLFVFDSIERFVDGCNR